MAGTVTNPTSGQQSQQGQTQVQNGSAFRVPKFTTQRRFLRDGNNGSLAATPLAGQTVSVPATTIDRLDIVRALQLQVSIPTMSIGGTGAAITPYYPYNILNDIELQFESAYKTFRLPGFLAGVMQAYRPAFGGPKLPSPEANNGANDQRSGQPVAGTAYEQPNLLVNTGHTVADTSLSMVYEIPVSMEFDIYYELDLQGNPLAKIPRAVVSPQYMAATTRSVTPTVIFNPMNLVAAAGTSIQAPANSTSAPTYTGAASLALYRDGWFPANTISTPPVYGWQYSRDYFTYPISGQTQVTIPLDTSTVGQGQILSMVGVVFDPASGSNGAPVQLSGYSTNAGLQLLYGSNLVIRQDNPVSMQYEWLMKHGQLLPNGFFGWDLALDDYGLLTNEFALNTLTTAGVQARIQLNSAPSASAVAYIAIESLKAVSS